MKQGTLLKYYHKFSKADKYILAFAYDEKIYFFEKDKLTKAYTKLDRASRGAGNSLRVSFTAKQKKALAKKSICLCEYNDIINDKYNKGEMVEKKIFEYFNQKWEKDNIPFYVKGDITLDGKETQIKFQNATCTNEKQIARLKSLE